MECTDKDGNRFFSKKGNKLICVYIRIKVRKALNQALSTDWAILIFVPLI